jgi:hypothetical protein
MSLQDSNKINITQAVARKTGVYTIEFNEDNDTLQVKRTENNGTVTEFPIPTSVRNEIQGYIGLLSAVYFDGDATASEIAIEEVDVWKDVVMDIHPQGVSDERPNAMGLAQSQGYEGDGSEGNPIVFLLEGLEVQSAATLRASLSFTPDEDGGRLDSRVFLERHSAASPSEDFSINAAGLAMESGADEDYPHLVSLQFFIGDTINTNGVGDAGKIRFQIKSDVTGTVKMNEMALFIQL